MPNVSAWVIIALTIILGGTTLYFGLTKASVEAQRDQIQANYDQYKSTNEDWKTEAEKWNKQFTQLQTDSKAREAAATAALAAAQKTAADHDAQAKVFIGHTTKGCAAADSEINSYLNRRAK